MGRYTVVITGASGSVYGLRLIEQLAVAGHEVAVILTQAGREVMAYELEFDLPTEDTAVALKRYLELPKDTQLRVAHECDLFDPLASGSHPVDAMIVCPASMGFCAALAGGLARKLPERAADVALKERVPLILVPRETPLSLVHLRNLTALTEAGAIVLPATPAFYQRPESIDDRIDFVVGKILDVLGIEHALVPRWGR